MPLPETIERDRAMLRFIYNFTAGRGYPPALGDIGAEFGLGKTTVFHSLERLQAGGLLAREVRGNNRAIALTPDGRALIGEEPAHRAIPVFHSGAALRRWLDTPVYRERVPAGRALCRQRVTLRGEDTDRC